MGTLAKRSYKISDSSTTNYLPEEQFSNCEFPPREHGNTSISGNY